MRKLINIDLAWNWTEIYFVSFLVFGCGSLLLLLLLFLLF